jgi:hypothetical protein
MRSSGERILLVLLFTVLFPVIASASSLRITWNANTETDLAGYKVYYGTQSGTYGTPIVLGKVTSYDLPNVATGKTYFVALTAYNSSGSESPRSTEMSAYVPAPQAQPLITLVSPVTGTVQKTTPKFVWSGTGFVSYKVYASTSTKSYSRIYSGTGTSCSLSSTFWSLFVPSGSTIYWYVAGTTSSGQVITSTASSFKKQ